MVMEQFSLAGKAALVTGGSRGLGQAMALALAEAGADVAIVGRHRETLAPTAERIAALGRRTAVIVADVSIEGEPRRSVVEAVEAFGRLDILINAAGTALRKSVLETTERDWDALVAQNIKSAYFASQAAAEVMIRQGEGGVILNVASLTATIAFPNLSVYAATRSGILGITRTMALEWAPHRIRVNAIAPGYFRTEQTRPLHTDPERYAVLTSRIPMGRWGEPEDLAGAAVFLTSDASRYMTGSVLTIDGGWLAG